MRLDAFGVQSELEYKALGSTSKSLSSARNKAALLPLPAAVALLLERGALLITTGCSQPTHTVQLVRPPFVPTPHAQCHLPVTPPRLPRPCALPAAVTPTRAPPRRWARTS